MFYGSSEQHRSSDYSQLIRIGLSPPPVGGAAEIVVTVHDGCAITDDYRFQDAADISGKKTQKRQRGTSRDLENSCAHKLTFYQILTSSTLACYPSADPRLVRY
jgi:hypothetical protein